MVGEAQSKAEQVKRAFKHCPLNDLQTVVSSEIRVNGQCFSEMLVENCPTSPELSLALDKIEEAVFWASAAIARN